MLDLKFIRENTDLVKKGITAKNFDPKLVDEVLELDKKKRAMLQKLDAERAEKNIIAEEYSKKPSRELEERGKIIKHEIQAFELDLKDIEEGLKEHFLESQIHHLIRSLSVKVKKRMWKLKSLANPKSLILNRKTIWNWEFHLGFWILKREQKLRDHNFIFYMETELCWNWH